jgi:ABC-type glycerol-3-phosphate transport system permease component
MMRQFMLTVSPALDEAARIDGASEWQLFWDIVLPLCRPGLIALSVLTFLGSYGSLYWPLVMTRSERLRTLPIGLLFFDSSHGPELNLLMAASLMAIIPSIVLFVTLQKYIVSGLQAGGVKG